MTLEQKQLLVQKIQRICCELEHVMFLPTDYKQQLLAELEILKVQLENVKRVLNENKDNQS